MEETQAKTSLYHLLGVEQDADQETIDQAYRARLAELAPSVHLGHPEAVNQQRLLRDGYPILSDPERRKQYDEWLAHEAKIASAQIHYHPTGQAGAGRWGAWAIAAVLFAMFVAIWAFAALMEKTDRIRAEYNQSVAEKRAENEKPTVINIPQPNSPAGNNPTNGAGR